MTKLKLDLVCQVAVVVPDLEKGLEQVRTLFGIDRVLRLLRGSPWS